MGTLFVLLKPWDDRKGKEHHVQSVIAKITQATADMKEATIRAITPPAIPGLGQSSGFTFQLQQTSSTDNIKQERLSLSLMPVRHPIVWMLTVKRQSS